MKLLLDTHVFIWAVAGDKRLKNAERAKISAAKAVYWIGDCSS